MRCLNLSRRLKRIERRLPSLTPLSKPIPSDPVTYAQTILGVSLTPDQQEIARALLEPPYKVMVDSGHSVGKTHLAAVMVNWWFDYFNPGVVITTAPSKESLQGTLWTEVRLQRLQAKVPRPDCFIGDAAPHMKTSPDHWAMGYTARKGGAFQGRHRKNMFLIFDEQDDIEKTYYDTARSMFSPGENNAWLGIGNPVSTTSQAYLEQSFTDRDGNPAWRIFKLSALNHPNIRRELDGLPPEIPTAVRLDQVNAWISEYGCEPISAAERTAKDFEWPPESGEWYRPGPVAEARILGRRPSSGTFGIWSDALWQLAVTSAGSHRPDELPELGCDVARYGDDYTTMHSRWGTASLAHERHNGWSEVQTAGRLQELCRELAARATAARDPKAAPIDPKKIIVKVDDTGIGGGVTDIGQANGYTFIGVSAAAVSRHPLDYPNKRSELWFATAKRADIGGVCLSGLSRDVKHRLRQQAMAPTWKMDTAGRRVVEKKEETKEKVGGSPDDMDALNLAYYPLDMGDIPIIDSRRPQRDIQPRRESQAERRRLFRGQ